MLDKTRSYNTISKPEFGSVIKTSTNSKLLDETNYYSTIETSFYIPAYVRVLFPRRLDQKSSISAYDKPPWKLHLEYIPLQNAFYYVLGNYGHRTGIPILTALNKLHLQKDPRPIQREMIGYLEEMYIGKTEREYNKYKNSDAFISLENNVVAINGVEYQSFDEIWPKVKKRYFTDLSIPDEDWAMIHGDCCLSNILIDPESGTIKFIDVRGSFGRVGIYGHILYDYAKLLHSIDGGYEYIIYDEYEYRKDQDGEWITYELLKPQTKNALMEDLFGHLSQKTMNFVRAIEGTIFIGMCHRHAGNPERQRIMYLQGLRILNEVCND